MYNENVMPGITAGIAVGALPGDFVSPGRGSSTRNSIAQAISAVKHLLRTLHKQLAALFNKTGSRLESGGELYENGRPRYRVLRNLPE